MCLYPPNNRPQVLIFRLLTKLIKRHLLTGNDQSKREPFQFLRKTAIKESELGEILF